MKVLFYNFQCSYFVSYFLINIPQTVKGIWVLWGQLTINNKYTNRLSCWIRELLNRKKFNTTVVAVANKLVRMALAMLKSGNEFRQPAAQ